MTQLTAPPPTRTRACPKCGNVADLAILECPRCSVIIDKVVQTEPAPSEPSASEGLEWMNRLAETEQLSVKQSVERLEKWTGIETANSYVVKDGAGNLIFHATEEAGSVGDFLARNYLKSARPFTMRLDSLHGETALVIQRPFRFFFSTVEISDPLGKPIGTVEREFAILNSVYTLTGRRPNEKYEIFGPIFRPWTFKIRRAGLECGLITKKWGGLGREMMTDADSFGVQFPPGISPELKAVFLGAVFLIDFAHFEDNAGN